MATLAPAIITGLQRQAAKGREVTIPAAIVWELVAGYRRQKKLAQAIATERIEDKKIEAMVSRALGREYTRAHVGKVNEAGTTPPDAG